MASIILFIMLVNLVVTHLGLKEHLLSRQHFGWSTSDIEKEASFVADFVILMVVFGFIIYPIYKIATWRK